MVGGLAVVCERRTRSHRFVTSVFLLPFRHLSLRLVSGQLGAPRSSIVADAGSQLRNSWLPSGTNPVGRLTEKSGATLARRSGSPAPANSSSKRQSDWDTLGHAGTRLILQSKAAPLSLLSLRASSRHGIQHRGVRVMSFDDRSHIPDIDRYQSINLNTPADVSCDGTRTSLAQSRLQVEPQECFD